MLGKAAVNFSTHLFTDGSQRFLQVKGPRECGVECYLAILVIHFFPRLLKINNPIVVALFIECNRSSVIQMKPELRRITHFYIYEK